eukprot:1135046-Pleurochrysis_carterae.AAC.1
MKGGHDSAAIRDVKDQQRLHSEWFMRQRRELDNMRHSGGRHDTLFEQERAPLKLCTCYERLSCRKILDTAELLACVC